MQQYEKVSHPLSKKKIIVNNFMGGIFWGIGSALGAVLLLTVLGFIIAKLDVVPFVGDFIAEISQTVKKRELQTQLIFTDQTPTPTPKTD